MPEHGVMASWIDSALDKVQADLARARAILSDAMARLFSTFSALRTQLAEETVLFERALQEVNGGDGDAGLVGILRDVLSRFVDDMVRIGASSVKIMMEVESLRGHTQQVAASGLKIEQIASTTRMLSLNARIEAQRIGAAGAVFRVVADEIKGLAHQTAELSQAIRDALATQSHALTNTSTAVARLAASDLDHAVASHRQLNETIAKLAEMSSGSLQILARIQFEADAAIQALQFEDMLTQLLHAISGKLELVRTACTTGDPSALAELDARVHRDIVTQQTLATGSVELF
jgi:methyl-accepting chemotaxis protein